jgi:hypothetical protein
MRQLKTNLVIKICNKILSPQKSLGYYMFKGGFRLGGRLLLVTGVFSLVSTTITVYRNKVRQT